MKEQRPSFTASLAAFGRVVGAEPQKRNLLAQRFLPAPLAAVASVSGSSRIARALVRAGSFGMVDHASLRMLAIDEALEEFLSRKVQGQLVVLGAGWDTRAWRFHGLKETTVFEVDHPATQKWKRKHMDRTAHRSKDLVYVPTNFEKESVAKTLKNAGHRSEIPTFWIWEGVTMYLSHEAIGATLEAVSGRSAPQSELAVSYLETRSMGVQRRLAHHLFRLLGEPLLGGTSRENFASRLERSGFAVVRDESTAHWGRNASVGDPLLASVFRAERLAVARRL